MSILMQVWKPIGAAVIVLLFVAVWVYADVTAPTQPAQYGPVPLTQEQYDAIMRDHAPGQPAQVWKLGPFKTRDDCERAARRLGVKLDCTVGGP
jgi:hypothetical protein